MVTAFKKETLLVNVYESRTSLGQDAAALVKQQIDLLLKEKAFINMIFAAAPSQNEFLASLREMSIDWSGINAFHMDEYIGLPSEAPQRFSTFLKDSLFDHVKFNSQHFIQCNNENWHAETRRYTELLTKFPPDIICMGIGENGHLAFNDPPVADFRDPDKVKRVELDNECRQQQVNDGCFSRIEEVPTHALTLTIPMLLSAKYIYCIVPGKTKSRAVYNTLNKEIRESHPSTILRRHPNATLFIDSESAALLSKQPAFLDA